MSAFLQPDLAEARRLLGAGFKLVRMRPLTKRPDSIGWNLRPVTEIDPQATGYGLILAANKLCSIDPDNLEVARVGMRALGFDLEQLMGAGVRTRSTRPRSGGRSTFAADGEISWLTFKCGKFGTVIEFRADSPSLQDTIPGIVYMDKAGALCRQEYANDKRLDDAPPLPDELLEWWELCSTNIDALREQQAKFFDAVVAHFGESVETVKPHKAISTGKGDAKKLAFPAPGLRGPFNRKHSVPEILERHGYTYHRRLERWSCPTATGAPGIHAVPDHEGLWYSDHASDPLHGRFDAWVAHVVLDHGGDVDAAIRALALEPQRIEGDSRFGAGVGGGTAGREGNTSSGGAAPRGGQMFSPAIAKVRADLFENRPLPPEYVVRDLLPRACGARVAEGGTGKTSLSIAEAVHIVLGRPLYGREVLRPGPVVFVTAEDEREVIEYRLHRVIEGMRLSPEQRRHVVDNLYIEDKSDTICRLVDVSLAGELTQSKAVDELVEAYRDIGPSLVNLDPQTYFGPGERMVNDGEAELMRAGRRLSRGLDCAVRFEHHTGKGNARTREVDQYAGRGGSAGADNARFLQVLTVHRPDDKLEVPTDIDSRDIAQGNVLRLHMPKNSYGPRLTAPVWIVRDGFSFRYMVPRFTDSAERRRDDLRRLFDFVSAQQQTGVRHSANSLEGHLGDLGLRRGQLRALVHASQELGHLVEQKLPDGERKGRRQTFLALGVRP
jgi:hypothetical protein